MRSSRLSRGAALSRYRAGANGVFTSITPPWSATCTAAPTVGSSVSSNTTATSTPSGSTPHNANLQPARQQPTHTQSRGFSLFRTPAKRVVPHHSTCAKDQEKLVILGSGWAGYKLMQEIDSERYNVTLVSPRNHFLFTPLLASAAVGGSALESVCEPVRPLAAEKGARFYEAKATGLDKVKKVVTCETEEGAKFPIPYDKLVVSVGYQANDFGIKDLADKAFFLKETGDASRLHDHILRCFEDASFIHMLDGDETLSKREEKMIRDKLSFVVVGAGPTGTELCGELTDFLHREVRASYPHLAQLWSVRLLDAADKVLGPFQDAALQKHAERHLVEQQGVDVSLNEFVDDISFEEIRMKSGKKFPFSTLVWCAGIKPLPIVQRMNLRMNARGAQILTDKNLRVLGDSVPASVPTLPGDGGASVNAAATGFSDDGVARYFPGLYQHLSEQGSGGVGGFSVSGGPAVANPNESIFAIGDCATIDGCPLPQTAQIAAQQGTYLAELLNSADVGEFQKQRPFENQDRGTLAYIGGTSALYKVPGWTGAPNLTGFLGYFTWRSAYWSMQLSNRNRMLLALNWTMNWCFGRDLTRIGDFSHPARVMGGAVVGGGKKKVGLA